MIEAVHRLDVTQESISKTCSLMSTTNQTSDICDMQIGWDDACWLPKLTKPFESLIRNRASTFVRILNQK
jgi:hypothetical protein